MFRMKALNRAPIIIPTTFKRGKKKKEKRSPTQSLVDEFGNGEDGNHTALEVEEEGEYEKVKLGKAELAACKSDLVRLSILLLLEIVDIALDVTMCLSFFFGVKLDEDQRDEYKLYSSIYIIHTTSLTVGGMYTLKSLLNQVYTIRQETLHGITRARGRTRENNHNTGDLLEEFELARAIRNQKTSRHIVTLAVAEDLITLFLVGYRLFFTSLVFNEPMVECLQDIAGYSLYTCMDGGQKGVFAQIILTSFCFFHKFFYIREIRELKSRIQDNDFEISKSTKRLASVLDKLSENRVARSEISTVVEIRNLLEFDLGPAVLQSGLTDFQILASCRKHCRPILTTSKLCEFLLWKQEYDIDLIRSDLVAIASKSSAFEAYKVLRDILPFKDEITYDKEHQSMVTYYSIGSAETYERLSEELGEAGVQLALQCFVERGQLMWDHFARKGKVLDFVYLVDATGLETSHPFFHTIVTYLDFLTDLYPVKISVALWKPTTFIVNCLESLQEPPEKIVICNTLEELTKVASFACIPKQIGGGFSTTVPGEMNGSWNLSGEKFLPLQAFLRVTAMYLSLINGVSRSELILVSNVVEYLEKPVKKLVDMGRQDIIQYLSSTPKSYAVHSDFAHTLAGANSLMSSVASFRNSVQSSAQSFTMQERSSKIHPDSSSDSVDAVVIPGIELVDSNIPVPVDKFQAHDLLKRWIAQLFLGGVEISTLFDREEATMDLLMIVRAVKPKSLSRYQIAGEFLKCTATRYNYNLASLTKQIGDNYPALMELPTFRKTQEVFPFDPLFDFDQVHGCIICLMHTDLSKLLEVKAEAFQPLLCELFEYYRVLRRLLCQKLGRLINVQIVFDPQCYQRLKAAELAHFQVFVQTIKTMDKKAFPGLLRMPMIGLKRRKSLATAIATSTATITQLKRVGIHIIQMERSTEKTIWKSGAPRHIWVWDDCYLSCGKFQAGRTYVNSQNPIVSSPIPDVVQYFSS